MRKSSIANEELWDFHQRRQQAEWEALQPELAAFRASEEERKMKMVEEAALAEAKAKSQMLPGAVREFHVYAEQLAQCGREGVRFDRWQRAQRASL